MVAVEGKPLQEITQVASDDLHFVPIDYEKPLQADYLPAQLTAEDYPNLIAPGHSVDTVAVSAVLAAYNWAPRTDRYRRLTLVRRCVLFQGQGAATAAVPSEMARSGAECPAYRVDPLPAGAGMARPQQQGGGA